MALCTWCPCLCLLALAFVSSTAQRSKEGGSDTIADTEILQPPSPRVVLYIVVDDLRPELGAYGVETVHTPNIDSLARRSVVFDAAFAQQAVCGPSRNSFLSGRRPDASRSWNFINSFREDHPEWQSLPGQFKDSGWRSLGVGKIFHPDVPPHYDGDRSWSPEALPFENPCYTQGVLCIPCPSEVFPKLDWLGLNAWCEEEALDDFFTAERAIQYLEKYTNDSRAPRRRSASNGPGDDTSDGSHFEVPRALDVRTSSQQQQQQQQQQSAAAATSTSAASGLFLAVGLHKPHLPWQAEKRFYDLYPPIDNTSLAVHQVEPSGLPDVAFADNGSPSPTQPVNDSTARAARRAYYATVSGMDDKVGQILAAIDRLGLRNDTAVLLHSDHGWQLGEHCEWRKNTLFELATRVPLLASVPWIPETLVGRRVPQLVELVDVMPTLAEIAGLSSSTTNLSLLDGTSLLPLLRDDVASWKNKSAFSQYPRRSNNGSALWRHNGIDHVNRSLFTHMGYSIRTSEWRYNEWWEWDGESLKAKWGNESFLSGRELYSQTDCPLYPTNFDCGENANVAGDPLHAPVVAELSQQLRAAFAPQ